MSPNRRRIAAQFRSLQATIGSAVIALGAREQELRYGGRAAEADSLWARAKDLAHQGTALEKMRAGLLAADSEIDRADDLFRLTREARLTLSGLNALPGALPAATRLVETLTAIVRLA